MNFLRKFIGSTIIFAILITMFAITGFVVTMYELNGFFLLIGFYLIFIISKPVIEIFNIIIVRDYYFILRYLMIMGILAGLAIIVLLGYSILI
jgi:hypothetical protein